VSGADTAQNQPCVVEGSWGSMVSFLNGDSQEQSSSCMTCGGGGRHWRVCPAVVDLA
jgi:hypothetical protein